MTRAARWTLVGLIAAGLVVGLGMLSLPYLPGLHGSDADEIEQLVSWLDIGPGTWVADLGAGSGSHALAVARRVGADGHVYATELSVERLAELRQRSADLDNFTVVEGAVSRTNLPPACCDVVYSRNVYHHLTEPDAINADLHRALRPAGRLLVIDFEPGGPMDLISPPATAERHGGHGTPTSTVIEEVSAAGFRVVRGPEPWRGRLYAVLFERLP